MHCHLAWSQVLVWWGSGRGKPAKLQSRCGTQVAINGLSGASKESSSRLSSILQADSNFVFHLS
jgi:hypothetical protein